MNLHKQLLKWSTLFLILYSFASFAEIRYVSKTGSSIPPYTSWATAADSIMEAINISNFGDTIYVGNGVYKEQIVMIPGLSLIGAGMDSCIIDTRELITAEQETSVEVKDSSLLTGFNIFTAFNNSVGAGIAVSGNCDVKWNQVTGALFGIWAESTGDAVPFIYHNRISDCRLGIEIFNSNVKVTSNIISSINGSRAIEIQANQNRFPVIDSNIINSDTYGITMGYTFGMKTIIRNNVFVMDAYGAGIFGGCPDTAWIYNNLILGSGFIGINTVWYPTVVCNNYVIGDFSSGGISFDDYNLIMNNTVIGSPEGISKGTSNQVPIVKYNNSWGNLINYSGFIPDSTNVSVNPMVVNSDTTIGKLDLHLQMFSPLIDAGSPDILDKDSSRSDIGLYGGPFGEVYKYQDLAPDVPRNFTAAVDSEQILLHWNNNSEADFFAYRVYRDTIAGFQIDTSKLISEQIDTLLIQIHPAGIERLYYKITAVDNQGNESDPSNELAVIISSIKDQQIISNYILYQNYPNPFNPTTKIAYQLKERAYVKLYVYDIKGELVTALVNETKEEGYYEVEFIPADNTREESFAHKIASGIYIYRIMVRGENNIPVFTDSKKMIYLK